jgi:quercetin dioxygenase-like cupin family protein
VIALDHETAAHYDKRLLITEIPCMLSERLRTTTPDDAPAYWFLNNLHILLAKSESTGGAYSLIHLTASPGFETPYHLHHSEDEAFYVLDGKFTFICDGKKTVLGAGGYIFLPRGVPHGMRCSSEKTSRVLINVHSRLGNWVRGNDARDGSTSHGTRLIRTDPAWPSKAYGTVREEQDWYSRTPAGMISTGTAQRS